MGRLQVCIGLVWALMQVVSAGGGGLTVTQTELAVFDNTTGEYHVQLHCILHESRALSCMQVTWVTPSGEEIPGSMSDKGSHSLSLANPVKGGTYTCRLSPVSPPAPCLTDLEVHTEEVNLHVDTVAARLTLLEAREQAAKEDNRRLKEELRKTRAELSNTRTALGDVNHTLVDNVRQLRTNLTHLTQNGRRAKHAGFHAILNVSINDLHIGDSVPFNDVRYNHGGAYNPKTGVFVAPESGSYFFVFTVSPILSGQYSNSVLRVTRGNHSTAQSYLYSKYDTEYVHMSTSHALVELKRGDNVCVEGFGLDLYYYYVLSSFSGFLVNSFH